MRSTYSPRQIQVATFLGGPLAAAYFLKQSFEAIDRKDLAKKFFFAYLIISAIILVILPFLPEETPNNIIPLVNLIPVVMLLKKHYLTKAEITESEEYKFESSWKVFGISLASLLVYSSLAVGIVLLAQSDDDVAQYLVDNVNSTDFELNPDYFSKLEAEKDPNGSGALLNLTLNDSVVYDFKGVSQEALRPIATSFFEKEYLSDLAGNNVYIIVNFQTSTHEIVNKVILSPSNLESN